MRAGDAFHFHVGDDHLWIVISDPEKDPANVLLVNVTTWRADKEQTCLLGADDHPALDHNSCIQYRDSRVHSDAHLNHLHNSGRITLHDPAPAELLARIRAGAGASKMMRLDHGQILIAQGLIEF